MSAWLAAAPIATVLAALGLLRTSAATAGAAGLAMAVLIAPFAFGLGAGGAAEAARTGVGVLAEALHATGAILWIVLPALALYELQRRSGALARICDALAGLAREPRLQVVLIAWFFGLFMEGAAGFGAPAALAAPLLVGLGFPPVRAVALALLGHAAGVSFGAVGTPVLAQAEISGLAPGAIATATAALHLLSAPVLLLFALRLAGDGPLRRTDLAWAGFAALCFLVPSIGLAAVAGPELPTLGGALVGAGVFIAALRRHAPGSAEPVDVRRMAADAAPYLAIVAAVLVTRLWPALGGALRAVAWEWSLDGGFGAAFQPLYHPGTLLLLGLVGGAAATGRAGVLPGAVRAALGRLLPVALALLAMLALARLMTHVGMIDTLADAARGAGRAWPLLAPAIGVLGTFVTGSATASNILFTDFQLRAAAALDLPPAAMAAAQGFGAAIGNAVAPFNIIAGAAAVGLHGRDGDILARTALAAALATALGGAALLALSTAW